MILSLRHRKFYRGTLAFIGLATFFSTCKTTSKRSDLESSVSTAESDEGLIRVIDCPRDPECPAALRGENNSTKLLAAGQDLGDQTLVAELDNQMGNYENYALDSSNDTGAKQYQSKTGTALERSTLLNSFAKGLWSDNHQNSPALQTGLTSLLNSLNPMLNELQSANTFANDNIDADNEAQRTKILMLLKDLATEFRNNSTSKSGVNDQMLTNLEILAGRDGWLNYGDQPRIAAPIPQLVSRIADQKISQTVPGIIAQQQQIYRAQLPLGGFFFGGIVDDQVESRVWEIAGQQKWQAMNDAALSFQTQFGQLMTTLNVKSYYLFAQDKTHNYLDPAPQVTEAELIAVIESLTGKKFDQLVAQSNQNGGKVPPLIPQDANDAAANLAKKFSLPDGIPLQEIHRLARASEGATKTVFPSGLRFKMLADGRIQISHNTKVPSVVTTASGNQSPGPYGSSGDFVCAGVTKRINGVLMLFLESNEDGVRLSVGSSQGWYTPATKYPGQPPKWPLIFRMDAHPTWETTDKIKIKLEKQDGTIKLCQGKIFHL